ncbi:hypothetical protein [Ornithinimicrobium cavernae]|uniref:hypothetical protein n=1 Tax=Ornithinimicrobium cavernae TaxID=2666047 RepID=UPI0012B16450|nr:hypothetical protein [Ornithinimicrobium cavernae]
MSLSPSWAMSGQAIDGRDDTHLAPGNHLRILTNPLLGLPVCPIVVQRVVTTRKQLWRQTRTDAVWVDSHGSVLTPPFTLTAGNPVTAYLPRPACWVHVEATPTRIEWRPPVVGPVRPVPGPVVRRPRGPEPVLPPTRPPVVRPALPPVERPGVSIPVLPRLRRLTQIVVQGMVTTPLGDAPVAVRSRAPYQVYASQLERVVISGAGTVEGIRWLDPARAPAGEPWRTLPLPCGPGARYAGPGDGWDRGLARAHDAAPTRFGMHEQPLAPGPAACDPVGAGDELVRVEHLGHALKDELDRLVNDTSASQQELSEVASVTGLGDGSGTSDRSLLTTLLQATLDPGAARWLPFADIDPDLEERDREMVVLYLVSAAFSPDLEAIAKLGLTSSLPSAEDPAEVIARLAKIADESWDGGDRVGRGMQLDMVLVAPAGVPLDVPRAPSVAVSWDGSWQSVPPPAASRRLTADLDRLVPGAALASAVAQPDGTDPDSRHLKDSVGRLVLLGPSQPATATTATQGRLTDRGVTEEDGAWQIAQADWFGRWSGWTRTPYAAGSRPRPPRPVVMLATTGPTVPVPVPTGPLAGTVRIEVPVPPASGLPPGASLLDQLELTVSVSSGGSTVSLHPVAADAVVVPVAGPLLMPTTSGTATVTARWLDTAGVASEVSEPRTATLHDPRAPAPVVLPATLTYTARPDATGWAQTTLSWPAQPGQASFRVFLADESTLRSKLEEVAAGTLAPGDAGQAPSVAQAQALLDDLDAAPGAPERGAAWETHRTILPRRWFLQLTADPVPASPTTTFRHQVSGSLTVLVLYRVVAVSTASVESDFRTAPILPRAVPNVLAPPTPAIRVAPTTTDTGDLQASLTVTVPAGPTPAARWRLRRATATTEAALMQVVAQGTVPPAPPGATGDQVFEVIDTGAAPGLARTSLSGWVRYAWRVEVAGPDLPGGGPPGEWSAPSAPASALVMPPDPPAAVTGLTAARDAAGVHVQFLHAGPLSPGASTGYVLDVYRRRPGEAMRLATSVPGLAAGPGGVFDVVDPDPAVPAGTAYRVVMTDPIGRRTAPSEEVVAP